MSSKARPPVLVASAAVVAGVGLAASFALVGAPAPVPAATSGAPSGTAPAAPCDAPDTDTFVRDLRERTLAYDELAAFAVERYGDPLACEGEVTTEFDGAEFGTLRLTFPDGVTLDVETMPPATSIHTLRRTVAFEDEAEMRDLLQRRAARIGLSIDWETPEVTNDGDREEQRYWDPDTGLNASAVLVYEAGALIAVGMSMAL